MTLSALFATPIVACARSNAKIGDGPLPATSVATPSSNGSSNSTTDPLLTLRMLDKTHGWALTRGSALIQSSILKTADGGLHWQDVTPANANLDGLPRGDFLNDQDAWVVTAQEDLYSISVLRTTNGGKSWQSSTIQTTLSAGTDMPDFLNPSDGWLWAFDSPGAGTLPSAIFHTTDGGQHWNKLATEFSDVSGIFFSDVQNGWTSVDSSEHMNPAQPWLGVTHDGSQTWYGVQLPMLPGAGKDNLVHTTPPVFFGKSGLLPVQDIAPIPSGSGLDLYVTHDGGQTWTPTKFLTLGTTVDVVDMHHAWALTSTDLYATSDAGQSWTKLPQPPQTISELRFLDTHNGWAINTTTDKTKNQPPNLLHTTDGGRTWQPINYSIVGKSTAPPPTANGPMKSCGTLDYQQVGGVILPSSNNAQQAANCFSQAFEQCLPASLVIDVVHSIIWTPTPQHDISDVPSVADSDTTYFFETKWQSGSCVISVVEQKAYPYAISGTCTQVKNTGTDLSFVGCGNLSTTTFPLVQKTPTA